MYRTFLGQDKATQDKTTRQISDGREIYLFFVIYFSSFCHFENFFLNSYTTGHLCSLLSLFLSLFLHSGLLPSLATLFCTHGSVLIAPVLIELSNAMLPA